MSAETEEGRILMSSVSRSLVISTRHVSSTSSYRTLSGGRRRRGSDSCHEQRGSRRERQEGGRGKKREEEGRGKRKKDEKAHGIIDEEAILHDIVCMYGCLLACLCEDSRARVAPRPK